jgi:hypothetical protein
MLERLRLDHSYASTDLPLPSRLTGVIAITATLLVGLGAAGCGSSSKSTASSSSTPPALSKPQFLAQGNAICKQGNQRLGAAQRVLGGNPSKAQVTSYVRSTFVPDIQSQIDEIRALGAPSADKATMSSMLDIAQADLNRVKSNPLLLATGHPFANFAKLAHPYGLAACASNS